MLDTCFILTLLYDKDPKNKECIEVLSRLIISGSQLYITDITSAEILNQIPKKLFQNDIRYKIDKVDPLNSECNIDIILNSFNKHDRKLIKEKRLEKFNQIPFNKYFHNLSKNPWKKDLLKVYYVKAVEMHTQMERLLKFKNIPIDSKCINLAKELMKNYILPVNDSYHIACAEFNGIHYFITLDSDFEEIRNTKVVILKI
ncbi:MAG: PIN domain-containing protein [Clostridium sp.]